MSDNLEIFTYPWKLTHGMVHNAKRTGHEPDKDIETPSKNMSKGPKHCTPIGVISGFLTLAIIGMLVHLEIQIFDIKSKLTNNGKYAMSVTEA